MKLPRLVPLVFAGLHTVALTVAILVLPPVPRSESVNLLEPQPTEGFSLSGPYRLPVAYSFVAERVFTLHNYRQPFRLLFLPELVILGVAHLLASLVFLVFPGLTAWLLSWLHFAFLIGLGGAQWWGLGVIVANRLPSHRSTTSRGRA